MRQAQRPEQRIGRWFIRAPTRNDDRSSLPQGAQSTTHLDTNAARRAKPAAFERANLEVVPVDVHLRPRQRKNLSHYPKFEGAKTVANKSRDAAVVDGSHGRILANIGVSAYRYLMGFSREWYLLVRKRARSLFGQTCAHAL